jgi:hypothetical protein
MVSCGDQASEKQSPSVWVGHTYVATPADPFTYLSSPSNRTAAEQLADFVPNFLLKVTSASADKVTVVIAPAKKQTNPPEQDLCNVTVNAVATVSSYPKMQIGPIDFPLYITNPPTGEDAITAHVTVHEFSFADILPRGSQVSEAGKFSALVDAREIMPLVRAMQGQSAESLCAAMKQSFATECVTCPDSQVLCLHLEAADFGADETTVDVASLTQTDLDAACPKP